MTTTPQFDQVWGNTQAEGITEDNPPPAGYLGIPVVADAKMAVSKKNETYMLVEWRDEQAGYQWSDIRILTKGGVAQEGAIKGAKIALRELGIDQNLAGAQVNLALQQVIGTYYSVERRASDKVNPATGAFYTNTVVNSKAGAPAGAPAVQPPAPVSMDLPWDQPAQQPAPVSDIPQTLPPMGAPIAPAAAPAPVSPQVQTAQAQPGFQAPSGQTAEVFAPSQEAQAVAVAQQAAVPTAGSIDPATGRPFGF